MRSRRARAQLRSKFQSIGLTQDYSDLDLSGFGVDLQGWGSDRPLFAEVMAARPSVVIEVGTWKGASLLHMRSLSPTTQFIAIDTWLGCSVMFWTELRDEYRLVGGFPALYQQFIANVLAAGAERDVWPLPITSTAGAHVLAHLGVTAEVIYIDASHEEEDTASELRLYWPLLEPGGTMFGDDYNERWSGVMRAVDAFAARASLDVELTQDEMWLVRKPRTGLTSSALSGEERASKSQ